MNLHPQCISLKNHVSADGIHINSPSTARRLEDSHCSHSSVWYASVSLGESLERGKIQQRANPSVSTGRCSSKVKAVDHQHSCNGPQSESRTWNPFQQTLHLAYIASQLNSSAFHDIPKNKSPWVVSSRTSEMGGLSKSTGEAIFPPTENPKLAL